MFGSLGPRQNKDKHVPNPLDVSITPTSQAGEKTKPTAGGGGRRRDCPEPNQWLHQDVRTLKNVTDWFNAARWFAAQIKDVGKTSPYRLAIDTPSVTSPLKKGVPTESDDGKADGVREFRTRSLYGGGAFGTMILSNAATWGFIGGALAKMMADGGSNSMMLLASVAGVANLCVSWATLTMLENDVTESLNKPLGRALKAKAYCDKLAWTSALYHNILNINPIPRIPGLELVLRSDWTTSNPFQRGETKSVFWVLARVREAGKDAYSKCHKQSTTEDIETFVGDKFFDDKLSEAKSGISNLSARYLRLPNMLTWASIGPGAVGGALLAKVLIFGL